MVTRHSADGYTVVAPGIELRTVCHGEATMMVEFRLLAGHELPSHFLRA